MSAMSVSFAQKAKIEGTLLLSSDSSLIIGAHIFVRDKSAHTISQAISDSNGYFALTVNTQRAHQLFISSVGVYPMTLSIDGLKNNLSLGKLYLDERATELEEVSVVANNHSISKQILFPKRHQVVK